jgi:hypothetical protein
MGLCCSCELNGTLEPRNVYRVKYKPNLNTLIIAAKNTCVAEPPPPSDAS